MTSSAIGRAQPRLRGALSYDERAALLFVAPLAVVLLAVAVFPILYSFYVSLFSIRLTRPGLTEVPGSERQKYQDPRLR